MESNSHVIEPQDTALDAFRGLFAFPSQKVVVSEDGLQMKLQVRCDRLAAQWLLAAQHLISVNQLPLEAEIEEFKLSGLIFDRWLVIQFVGQMTPLECF